MAKIPILSVYDKDGNRIEVPAIVGRSAYQDAARQGFDGSLADWLESLHGNGIVSFERTSGDGSAGNTDVYTITYSNGDINTFTVYNGKDGSDVTKNDIEDALGFIPAKQSEVDAIFNKIPSEISEAVEKYLNKNPVDGGVNFTPGNALELTDDGTLNVRTTNEAEIDNTLPITSAGVHTIVGNIGAIIDTI